MVKVAEGVGSAPTSVVTDPVFETGAASLYLPAFHKWSGWQEWPCDLLVSNPDRSGLLTIHPEIGCQGWTRTNTERLNPDSESGLL